MRPPLRTPRRRIRAPYLVAVALLATGSPGCAGEDEAPRTGTASGWDGVPVAYESLGAGPTPLVFVHGWMCDRTFWQAQTDVFAADHRVVLIDLGGHGESGRSRSDWSVGGFAEDVVAVLEALELDDAILIGHSMGGPVVAEAAARAPNRILGVVAVDAYQYFELPVLEGTGVDAIVAPFEADFVAAARNVVQDMFVEASDPALVDRITGDMLAGPPEVGVPALRSLFEWYRDEGAGVLGGLTVPVTVINSTEYSPTDLDLLGEIAPGADVQLMDGVGHFVMLEDAPRFNALLADVIADMTGQRG